MFFESSRISFLDSPKIFFYRMFFESSRNSFLDSPEIIFRECFSKFREPNENPQKNFFRPPAAASFPTNQPPTK